MNKQKTVFFGPFFGEFGWEVSFWHGWVKKMCRERYKGYKKIVASYPGREPFYPDADEFWPHPLEISKLRISQRGYISDFWVGDLPKGENPESFDKNISAWAEALLQEYQKKLPSDTIFYVPHKLNVYQLYGKRHFLGVLIFKGLNLGGELKVFTPKFEHQIFEELQPTEAGRKFLQQYIGFDKKLIAVFPRCRLGRRPDKNWPRQKYDLLIKNLQRQYPTHFIGIFGAPGGAYYSDGKVPLNCFDFINLPEDIRFSVQLSALKQSDVAVGGISGALVVALLAGCPVVQWGYPVHRKPVNQQNFLKTRCIFWPEMNPSVEIIEKLVNLMMKKKEKEIVYPLISTENKNEDNKESLAPRKINNFGKIKSIFKEIISRPLLFYLKRKKISEGVVNIRRMF